MVLRNVLAYGGISGCSVPLGEVERHPYTKRRVPCLGDEAVQLKENFRRKDVGFTIEVFRDLGIKCFLAVLDDLISIALPRQEEVAGLVKDNESLLHELEGAINEDQASLHIEDTEHLGHCPLQESIRDRLS